MEHILVIDDDDWVRQVIVSILEKEGYQVQEATNGEEGVNLCRETPVDIVITDIVMPVKDGLQTILELLDDFPDIKIIAISGGGAISPERYLKVASSLADIPTITKPFNKEELLTAIKALS